jgi:MFS transporter, putative metabolite:H+ symporter
MATTATAAEAKTIASNISARLERIPFNSFHLKARVVVGVATFFDGFDLLAIAYALPVIAPLWKLTAQQTATLISAAFFGQIFGALFFGWVAERFGRLRALAFSTGMFAIMSLGCAMAWDYDSLLVMRTIQGFGIGGEVPIAAAYISEIARAKGRGRFFLLYEILVPIGLLGATLAGWFMVPTLGWQSLFIVGAVPALLILVLRLLLPESPRWLASRGRVAEAEAALRRIEAESEASLRAPLPPPSAFVDAPVRRGSISDLLGPFYRRRTLSVWIIWFACYLIGFGLTTWMPTIYRTVFHVPLATSLKYAVISSVCGLTGCLICALLCDIVGRRLYFVVGFVGGAAVLTTLWWNGATSAEVVLIGAGATAFFISTVQLNVFLYTPEVYPTRIRALAVSLAATAGRLGSFTGPYVVGYFVGANSIELIFLAFAVIALFGALIAATSLVESKEKVLEDLAP